MAAATKLSPDNILTPQQVLEQALTRHQNIALSFSGAEDAVLIHMASRIAAKKGLSLDVFTLDTGRLHPETLEYIEVIRQTYQINLEILFPDASNVQDLVNSKGLFSFKQDGHQECCQIRKVAPLRTKLSTLDAWITGQRRDQSPDTRSLVDQIEQDQSFSTDQHPLAKYNPLAHWSSTDVWNYIRMMEVPYNPLHEQGFISIGCQPCTRAVLPGQHEREGRWWWEEQTQKECGLHPSQLITTDRS